MMSNLPARHEAFYLALAAAVCVGFGGCGRGESPQEATGERSHATPARPVPAEIWKEFSGDRAFAHVEAQVALGPRPAGSAELDKTRDLIQAELERNGWSVERQEFTDETPRGAIRFVNLIGRFGGSGSAGKSAKSAKSAKSDEVPKTQRFILASHYDTKVYDTIRFVGASDGASSTGALMELSRVLALDPALARQVELVFFDGEEAFAQFSETDGLYGSRHYARELRATQRHRQFEAGVLWDMIGDKDLTITLSPDSPPGLAQAIFAAADRLQVRQHFSYFRNPIWDDHVPLNQAGIPTINLIDFDYPYWHTADDTLDKLSPQSLQTVGAVTLHWLKTASQKPKAGR